MADTNLNPAPKKKPGRICRVSFGATVSLPNYENLRFDFDAEVGPDENWKDVMERLRTLVARYKDVIKEEGR